MGDVGKDTGDPWESCRCRLVMWRYGPFHSGLGTSDASCQGKGFNSMRDGPKETAGSNSEFPLHRYLESAYEYSRSCERIREVSLV